MEQEETKTPKIELRYFFRRWSDEYKPQPFVVKSVDKAEIVEDDRDNRITVVTKTLVDKICEFVNTKLRPTGLDVNFDGNGFWYNHKRLDPRCFIDNVVERIIVEELKRMVLANSFVSRGINPPSNSNKKEN